MTETPTLPLSKVKSKYTRLHTDLWTEAAEKQGRLLAEGWTLKHHVEHLEGVWVYHCTAWRQGLRKGHKAAASTPLEAITEAVRLARVDLSARAPAPAWGS